jgi:hypothetical protein
MWKYGVIGRILIVVIGCYGQSSPVPTRPSTPSQHQSLSRQKKVVRPPLSREFRKSALLANVALDHLANRYDELGDPETYTRYEEEVDKALAVAEADAQTSADKRVHSVLFAYKRKINTFKMLVLLAENARADQQLRDAVCRSNPQSISCSGSTSQTDKKPKSVDEIRLDIAETAAQSLPKFSSCLSQMISAGVYDAKASCSVEVEMMNEALQKTDKKADK